MYYKQSSRRIYLFVGDKTPEFKNKIKKLLQQKKCKHTYYFAEAKFSVLLKDLPLIKYIVNEMYLFLYQVFHKNWTTNQLLNP